MSTPLFTIITPSFQQAAYLGQTLESVVSQDFKDFEYLVYDGGSTDGSVEIIKSFGKKLAHWESAIDGGQAAAINKGLARASGKWVAFLNSDDWYLEGALAHIARFIEVNPEAQWICSGVEYRQDNGRSWGVKQPSFVGFSPKEWLMLKNVCPQPGVFVRRDVLLKCGFLDTTLQFAMDLDWWIRFSEKGFRPNVLSNAVAVFRIHDGSKTMSSGRRFINDHRRILERYRSAMEDKDAQEIEAYLSNREHEFDLYELAERVTQRRFRWAEILELMQNAPQLVTYRAFWGMIRRALAG